MKPIYLKNHPNGNGTLIPFEVAQNFPDFIPKRVFWCYGFRPGEIRGEHAHRQTNQILVCLQGNIHVELFDGQKTSKYMLTKNSALFVPKMIWDSEYYATGSEILFCLCDTPYDRSDYIEDKEEYIKLAKEYFQYV